MKEQLDKAFSIFVEEFRSFEVNFLIGKFAPQPWDEVLYNRLKPYQQTSWNNRKEMLGADADLKCLIDFDNMKGFVLGFKSELIESNFAPNDISGMATWLEEIHQVRNKKYHHNPMEEDEVLNAFLNMKKVAKVINKPELVEELDHLKTAQPVSSIPAVNQTPVPAPSLDPADENSPIPAWFTNVVPHYDIRNGSLDESVFAANLGDVALNTGEEVYINSTVFFQKTYITVGMKDLANRVVLALNGEETENRVISLQTGFGGGKTHALIALYHIANQGQELFETLNLPILEKNVKPKFQKAKVAVFTNNTNDVAQGRTTVDGVKIRTLWGELAYQLGGAESYEIVRANDESMIAPAAELFKKVLKKSLPSLLLIDELADYCKKASAMKVGDSSLSEQTISFMQTLTEVVASVRQSVLIVTLPASTTEVGSEATAQSILTALENRVVRVGTSIQPVQNEEIYEVIRRRLFESIGEVANIQYVVERYRKYYNKHKSELPSYANNGTYPDLIRKSYPFQPELIDMFRMRWGQDSRFQRTRGVLRLLASIVNDLWKRRHSLTGSQGLIHTGDLNLSNLPSLTGTITNLKGSQWDTVLHADVMGDTSNSYRIDNEDPTSNLCKYSIAQGVATTIMLASIGGSNSSNISIKEVKLCMMRPGAFKYAEIDNALSKLESVAHYLYTSNISEKNYCFQSRPNVNILLNQAKTQVATSAINTEIKNRLNGQNIIGSGFNRVLTSPDGEIPEQKALTLIILGPENVSNGELSASAKKFIKGIAMQKGSSPRVYRNTLLFLTCTEQGYHVLAGKLRDYLACKTILSETVLQDDQKKDVKERYDTANKESASALTKAYTKVVKYKAKAGSEEGVFEVLDIHDTASSDFKDYITNKVYRSLVEEEWVIRSIGQGLLKENNLFPTVENPVLVKDIYEAFLRYDDKPMLAGPQSLLDSIKKYCREGAFNVGYGEKGNYTAIDCKIDNIPHLSETDETSWLLDPSVKMPEPSKPDTGGESGGTGTSGASTPPTPGPSDQKPKPAAKEKHYKHIQVSGQIPIEHWTDLFTSFVNVLKNNGLKIEVKFDAKSTPQSEITENSPLFKSVKESASQLGLNLDTEE